MSDIILVAGNNEINLAMTPVVVAPALFGYASDVRQTPFSKAAGWEGMKYEVDIQNIGGIAGSCTAVGYVDSSAGKLARGEITPDFTMGTQVINPGQVATFKGQWEWYGAGEWDWWFKDGGFIISEAGPISFKYGRRVYPISFEIPPQIVAGSEFWTTQIVRLAGGTSWIGWAGEQEGDLFMVHLQLKGPQNSLRYGATIHALYGYPAIRGEENGDTLGDIQLLKVDSDYTIRGIYENHVSVPCKAIYWAGSPTYQYPPLPGGIYDVISMVYWSTQPIGYGHWHDRPIWIYKVGQVQII